MNVFDPTLTTMSSPVPPSKASPSIVPVKDIVTRSPLSTLRPVGLGGIGPVLLGDAGHRLVDFGVSHLSDRAFELDAP